MVRIIYGIAGEGMGHAVRSTPIIEELLKRHQVKIFTGGRAFNYLSNHFKDVNKIGHLSILYQNNSVANLSTFFFNLFKFPFILLANLKIIAKSMKYRPDIVISDFEPFTHYYSRILNIPAISINNQNLLTKTKISIPSKYKLSLMISKIVINLITFKSDYYLINTFLNLKNTSFMFRPVIRKSLIALKPKINNNILVYQTSKSNKRLLKTLKQLDDKFIVYGFNKNKKEANLTYKKFNERDFFKDIANCKGIITNGGFSLIADALYLHKPILSQPVNYQFEQTFNALNIKKLGYGEFHEILKKEDIKNFISNLDTYRKNLRNYKRYSNKAFFAKLEEIISSNSRP